MAAVDCIQLDTYSEGTYAGIWQVPRDGFEWRDDPAPLARRPLSPDGHIPAGPWLVPRGEAGWRTSRYALLRRPRLIDAFERIARAPTRTNILQFANTYGFLLDPRDQPQPGVQTPAVLADSYQHWAQETNAVSALRWLWRMAGWGREDVLSPYVLWGRNGRARAALVVSVNGRPDAELTRRVRDAGDDYERAYQALLPISRQPGVDVWHRELPLDGMPAGDGRSVAAAVQHFVRMVVNGALVGRVHLQVMHAGDGQLRSVPASLLGAVYLKLALEIAGGYANQRPCENPTCPNPVAGNRKRRYCSDRCGWAVRARRYRSGGPSR